MKDVFLPSNSKGCKVSAENLSSKKKKKKSLYNVQVNVKRTILYCVVQSEGMNWN